jgi:DNA-directed RNA polymerase
MKAIRADGKIAKPGSDPEADQTRFQILGLRRALSNIGTANLPLARQKALEEASYEVAREELVRSAKAMEERGEQRAAILQRNQLQAWMHRWVEDLTVKIRDELELMRERVETSRSLTMKDEEDVGTSDINKTLNTGLMEEALYLYLTVVPTEKLALITVLSLMRGLGSSGIADGIKAVRAMLAVGKAAETEYHAETLKNVSGSNSPLWTRLLAETRTPRGPDMIEDAWNKIGLKMEDDTAVHEAWNKYWTPSWTQKTNIEIGSWLLTMCVKTAKVERTGVSDKTGQVV